MRPGPTILGVSLFLVGLFSSSAASDLAKLKVVYVGDVGTPRAEEFESFLHQNVGQVVVVSRGEFKPADAETADVVLLDWPQSERTQGEWKSGHSPLGDRAQWHKPTVLLGSAGLNLAVVWKVRGGAG